MSEVTLFKNANGNVAIILPSLAKVNFIQGSFFTTDKRLEAELKKCAEVGEFGVFIDPKESSVDASATTPMEALRAKIRKELLAEMNNPALINAGNSTQSTQEFVSSVATTSDNELTGGKELTEEEAALKDASTKVGISSSALLNKFTSGKPTA